MHTFVRVGLVSVFVVALFAALFLYGSQGKSFLEGLLSTGPAYARGIVTVGSVEIPVDIANTPQTQIQGLSDRRSLPDNEGMFFIFEKASIRSFWMKDMHFPIDMIWIGDNLEIIDITENAQPDSYHDGVNPKLFTPQFPSKYVLEVNAGFARSHSIKIGDVVSLK